MPKLIGDGMAAELASPELGLRPISFPEKTTPRLAHSPTLTVLAILRTGHFVGCEKAGCLFFVQSARCAIFSRRAWSFGSNARSDVSAINAMTSAIGFDSNESFG
ncbi:MAG TPA: hypothetical protein VMJ32_02975 [Pirellulales bacterium]|nr:hypothetical protein [Pirellulales bacterium]